MAQKEMPLKDISNLELWQSLCSVDMNHMCNLKRRHYEKQFCIIILNLHQWFRRKCRFKGSSYLELWKPFCSAECNHLCNFERRYYKEQFCVIILNLSQWFRRRCSLNVFLSGVLAALLFGIAEPFMQFSKRAS